MAMTKKEQAELEALKTELALRRTAEVKPDLDPPNAGNDLRKGWLFNAYGLEVARACTSHVFHCYGRDDKTTTQGPRKLFSTRLLALKALRWNVEEQCAKQLRKIDVQIELEISEQMRPSPIK